MNIQTHNNPQKFLEEAHTLFIHAATHTHGWKVVPGGVVTGLVPTLRQAGEGGGGVMGWVIRIIFLSKH